MTSNGAVWAWGDNSNGQLGNSTTTNATSPVPVSTVAGARAVTAGTLSRDPLAPLTQAPYSYVGNDPLNGVDPMGLCSWNPFASDSCEVAEPAQALTRAVRGVLTSARPPDYVALDVSIPLPLLPVVPVGFQFTYSRSGRAFLAPESGVAVPGIAGALRGGWINSSTRPSCSYTNQFISGLSVTAAGFLPLLPPGGGVVGPSAAETWGNPGQFGWRNFATELGVGAGFGRSLSLMGSWSFAIPVFQGPGW